MLFTNGVHPIKEVNGKYYNPCAKQIEKLPTRLAVVKAKRQKRRILILSALLLKIFCILKDWAFCVKPHKKNSKNKTNTTLTPGHNNTHENVQGK